MTISIQVAQTPEELDDVFRLRYHVYVIEDNKFHVKDFPDERIYDRFDTYSPYNANLIAYDDGLPIGTIRFGEDSDLGLPQEEVTDIGPIRKSRKYRGKLFGIGMLAVRETHRRKMGFFTSLLKYLIALIRSRDGEDAVITINHTIEKMMTRLGFTRIGDKFYSEKIVNYIVPMYGTVESVGAQFREELLPQELSKFQDTLRRNIYNRGDLICKQGDIGDEAYIVIRGSVNVLLERGKDSYKVAILGPGELLGEISLIDDQPRSATLRANARETELMVLSRSDFEKALVDREAFAGILKMETERLRRTTMLALQSAEDRKRKIVNDFVAHLLEATRINSIFSGEMSRPPRLSLESAAAEIGLETEDLRPYWDQLAKMKLIEEKDGRLLVDEARLKDFSFEIDLDTSDKQ
ncbi:MAG: GNAT family N-acetyltransferase [Thermodesulfobacteriota bacterium]|nr:GNAT family N-acetyltransferase [Thermodesulfobacteriota bacterium]